MHVIQIKCVHADELVIQRGHEKDTHYGRHEYVL